MLLKEYVKNGTNYKKDLKNQLDLSTQKYQYLVMNITLDVIARAFWLPSIVLGETLVFFPVG